LARLEVEMHHVTARIAPALAAALCLCAVGACDRWDDMPLAATPSPDERVQLLEEKANALGFDLSDVSRRGSSANAVALTGRTESFLRRTDSFTYVATDARYYPGGKFGAFAGSDEALVTGARRALDVLGVSPNEVDRVKIEREYGQVAEYDPITGAVKAEPEQLLNRIVSFRRSIGGVPVFSSYARVGLTQAGRIGMLRVHWPQIDGQTLKNAQALQVRLSQGFKPPDIVGAAPENVAAGIVHSPAAGEVMDVAAVIRVVYRPTGAIHGVKPVHYFDGSGNTVPRPRMFRQPLKEPAETQPPNPRSTNASNPSRT
jgi:hypothetical protein